MLNKICASRNAKMRKRFLTVFIVLGFVVTVCFIIFSTRKGHSLTFSEQKGYADVMSVDSRPASVMQREQRMVSESEIQRETGSSSQLVVVPESLTAQVGTVARFNCTATNEESVYWSTKPYGSQQEHEIYIGEKPLVEEYGRSGRFSVEVDRTVRRYDLVIKDVKQSDAGVYICTDDRGSGKESSAELLVLKSETLTCHVDQRQESYMGENVFGIDQDTISFTCRTNYIGNSPPQLGWSEGGRKLKGTQRTESGIAFSSLILVATSKLDGVNVTCEVIGSHNTGVLCTSETIRVRYAALKKEVVEECPGVENTLNCNPPCSYKLETTVNGTQRCAVGYSGGIDVEWFYFYQSSARSSETGSPPIFREMQLKQVFAEVGQSILIPCKNDHSYGPISWYYYSLNNQTTKVVYNGEKLSPQFAKRFSADMEKRDLIVSHVKLTDAGTYECMTLIPSPDRPDRMKPIVVNAIKLTVLDGVFFNRSPESIVGLRGRPVVLPCITNLKQYIVNWKRLSLDSGNGTSKEMLYNGYEVSNTYKYNVEQYDLTVGGLDLEDAGTYQCVLLKHGNSTAVTAEGISSAELIVVDSGPICSANFTNSTELREGDLVGVTCHVSYLGKAVPVTQCHRTQPNKQLPTSQSSNAVNGTVVVNTVTIKVDIDLNGQALNCTTFFQPTSDPIQEPNRTTNIPSYRYLYFTPMLNVVYKPRNLRLDPEAEYYDFGTTVRCVADANPRPTLVEWHNTGNGQEIEGDQLTIDTPVFNTGIFKYRCTVTNIIGRSNSTFTIRVKGVEGVLTSVPASTLVVVGRTGRINCSTDLNQPVYWARALVPSDVLQWLYYGADGFHSSNADGRFSIDTDEATGRYDIIIADVQQKDAGQYVCFYKSGLGASAELVISDPIKCNSHIPSDGVMGYNVFGLEQDVIQISCSLTHTGNLSPTLEWSWPGSEVKRGEPTVTATASSVTSTLKLSATKGYNNVKFQCKASIEGATQPTIDSGLLWESETVNVRYAEFALEEVAVCPGVKWNLLCNPQCSYSFERNNDDCQCLYTYNDPKTQQKYEVTSDIVRCGGLTCEETSSADGYVGDNVFELKQDIIRFSCKMNYTGNLHPSLDWFQGGSTEAVDSEASWDPSSKILTSHLALVAKSNLNGVNISCKARLTPDDIAAAVGHTSKVIWTSKPIYVKYAVLKQKEVKNCPGLEWALDCNPPCLYQLEYNSTGSPFCHITYATGNSTYTRTFKISNGRSRYAQNLNGFRIALICLSVIVTVICGILNCIVMYIKQPKTPPNNDPKGL